MSSSSAVFIRTEARTPSPQLGGPLSPSHANIPQRNPQTPRRRKPAASVRLQGIKITMPNNLSIPSISRRLISTLKLQYTPDDWQVHLIHRILQGYDSIFCAGTGYGKSLVFEGLAILGGKGKVVIIVSPPKALERDQADVAAPGLMQFWPDHFEEVWFALWEIFNPHVPDRARWEAVGFVVCTLCVAHETACPGFDLFDFRRECKCKKLCKANFEEDQE